MPPTNCEQGYVYCPGYSTCFQDEEFNVGYGVVSDNPNAKPEDLWGWNIEYICGGTLHCEIWTGAKGCNFQKGRKVGTFEFNEHAATYRLFSGYESNSFDLYAGQCQGNDGGEFIDNGRWCLPPKVAANAREAETFPLQTGGAFNPTRQFTYSSNNEGRFMHDDPWETSNYDVFPLGRIGRHWMTAHVEVCPAH
jgi:hypothetical protein